MLNLNVFCQRVDWTKIKSPKEQVKNGRKQHPFFVMTLAVLCLCGV
jgi:hypothetical protein